MTIPETETHQAAIEWFARLRDSDADEATWLAFRDWLEADESHRLAYMDVQALWIDIDEVAEAPLAPEQKLEPNPVVTPFRPKPAAPRSPPWRMAAAAAVGAIMVGGGATAYLLRPTPPQSYRAPADRPLAVALADGSQVLLDRGSELKVSLEQRVRSVELVEGEARFQVTHDAARPFVVAAGQKSIRVVGTEFDVLRHADRLRVTVTHGVVAVGRPAAARPDVQLTAGEQFEQHGATALPVRRVDPEDVSGWNRGLLIYREAPLADVAADVSRYAGVPIQLSASAEALTFSGVLKIADGRAMLDRLEAFLPLKAAENAGGLTLDRDASAATPAKD